MDLKPLASILFHFRPTARITKLNLNDMRESENNTVGYQFTPTPKQLMHLLDVNCRTMLFALIDDSNYFANADGWFYRTNSDLQNDSKLSKNLVMVTIDTLFRYCIVEVSCIGKGKGKKPNGYKVNTDRFTFFEQLNMNTDIGRPENQIETVTYKGSGYSPSYLQDKPTRLKPILKDGVITWIPINAPNTPTPSPTIDDTNKITNNVTKSDNNIDSIDNIDNKDNINNKDNLLYNNKLNKELKEKEVIEEETLAEEDKGNLDEPKSKIDGNTNLNQYQLLENKELSPSGNREIRRAFYELADIKTYPSLYNVKPMDEETIKACTDSLLAVATSTKEQYKAEFEKSYRFLRQIRGSKTKEQMQPYTKALVNISRAFSM